MRNQLKHLLVNPIIESRQNKFLAFCLKVVGWMFCGVGALVIFIVLMLVGHYTGFEQWMRALMGVEG